MKTVFIAGKNRIAVDALKHVARTELRVVAVPNETDQGVDTWQPSLRKAAQQLGVSVETLRSAQFSDGDLVVSLEFEKIVRPQTFEGVSFFNIHFSLLPKYRGCFTSFWPIFNGEDETGVTLHEIDDGIDTGRIIDQKKIKLSDAITARELYESYQDVGFKVFTENLGKLVSGGYVARDQKPEDASYYSRSSFSKDQNELPLGATASQTNKFVRSYFFPEFQTATFNGTAIASCEITGSESTLPPGTVLSQDKMSFFVATKDFDVKLSKF